ncbi:TonB-dependent receptor [Mucilaginibacter sp. BJC16-A38]|uniref:TonB-dependent receptor n=1 Tax=Mucilaginibacter phenanthrenivorans TaxID=1234842 RepID=UPI00215817BA|nr:TonB-dependent receptor [Mucilaginibacter phenanthrenivorans]MCR8560021.1 TonB-dependent receptor [Mucilaginibacter phenanthrenivorans]
MKKLVLLFIIAGFSLGVHAQKTQQILKKNYVNKLYTCALDQMLDTLGMDYHLHIVFERDSLHKFDVVEHFFNDRLDKVFDKICSDNNLHYWLENDGTIYILQNTDDLTRLKKLNTLNNIAAGLKPVTIEAPKGPPTHFLFTVSGKVTDQNSGEALPSATVKIRKTDLVATTGTDGNFTIFNVPADTCVVEVYYSGYQPELIRLNAKNINESIVVTMYKSLNTLNEVTIMGKKSGVMNTDTKKVGVLQLSPANLDKLPNLGEKDIMRAFQLMPGVGATNESSSGAYVRGGTPDQNLVVFDGFTVYQVDHLYGFFSAFNSNAVKDVQLYKGGFSSMYGGRLSSVTEINGKDGNKNEANYGVDLSLLSFNAFVETPIGDKSSLLVAFRRSYQGPFYDKIFKQFNTSTTTGGGGGRGGFPGGGGGGFGEQTTPASHFYDDDIRYTYHINKTNSLAWSLYSGSDVTDNSRQLQLPSFLSSGGDINITDYTKYGNLGSSLKWFSQWSKKVHSNTYITYSSYYNDRNRTTAGTTTDSNGDAVAFSNGTIENNNLKDIGVKSEWQYQLDNKVKLLYGGFGSRQHINYDYIQNDTSRLIDQHNTAFIGGGYAELEYDPDNKLHLQPGMRTTWFQPTGKLYYEPRFSASYVLNDNYTLKAATGQFYQFMNEVTREDVANGNRNFWVLSNNSNIPVGMSRHIMGGISWENNGFLVDVEGYYKTLSGLTQYAIRQTGFAPGSAGTIEQDFFQGTGHAKGIELLLQKKLGRYTGWLSYTLARAENRFAIYGDTYYPADQDVTHEFKAVNMYHYYRWNFSAVFIFSTGHPYTAPLSTYTVTNADGTTSTSYNVGAKNSVRLPDYHRLDLSATYDLLKISGDKTGSIGISLFNVYNHVNTWYKEYQIQNNAVIATDVNYLGFTPNITLSLRWK